MVPKFYSNRGPVCFLLLEKRLASDFGNGRDVLFGSMEGILKPITLDLEALPLAASKYVCGVASELFCQIRSAGSSGLRTI